MVARGQESQSSELISWGTGENGGAGCGYRGRNALNRKLGEGILHQAAAGHVDEEIKVEEKIGTEDGLFNICYDENTH